MHDEQDQAQARMQLAQLKLAHEDFDVAIGAMIAQHSDPMRIQRMKKKKLELKDRIEKLASTIIPNLSA